MMKIVITESQYKSLSEITKMGGHYHHHPLESLFEFYNSHLFIEDKVASFKKFFKKNLGWKKDPDDDYFEQDVIDYFDNPTQNEWSEDFKKKDIRSGFAYFIAKNFFDLKEGVDVQYFVENDEDKYKIYHFFDPLLKIYVGKISIIRYKDLPKKSYKVGTSAADENLIGAGYGTKMYLTVIEHVDYLASDDTLFTGSYRMWKHTLSKYVNVWGVVEKGTHWEKKGYSYTKMDPNKKQSVIKYDFFIASSKYDKIK